MGIIAGLGLIVGTHAGYSGHVLPGLFLVLLIAVLAALAGSASQRLLIVAAATTFLGVAAGAPRQSEVSAAYPPPESESHLISVTDDARVAGRGWAARAELRFGDGGGEPREVLAFFPRSTRPTPGTTLVTSGEIVPGRSDLYFVQMSREAEPESALEARRQQLRTWLESRIQQSAPGSPGTLALGLIIGDDSALTTSERDDLRRSGLSHITAVSGWNVTILVGIVALMFRSLGKTGGRWLLLQISAIVGYVWLVGLEPPIVRAAIMGSLALFATVPGRPVHMMTLLSLTAGGMVLLDPEVLYSLAFQLSFLSMIGLVLAARLNRAERGFRQAAVYAMLVPAMAGLLTAPLIAARFGMLSVLSIPANIIVAPLTTPLAAAGLLSAVVQPFWPLSIVPGFVTWLLGTVVLLVARIASNVPFGVLEIQPFAPAAVIGLYLALLAIFSPWIAELGWIIRLAELKIRQQPGSALYGVGTASTVLLLGALLVM